MSRPAEGRSTHDTAIAPRRWRRKRILTRLVARVFGRSTGALTLGVVETGELDDVELRHIRRIIHRKAEDAQSRYSADEQESGR